MADTTQQEVVPAITPLTEGSAGAGPPPDSTFKMRGRDDGRSPGSDQIVWTFTGTEPDFAGTGFAGGTPTPIGSLVPGSVVKVATLGQP